MNAADTIATANSGKITLWHSTAGTGSDEYERTIGDYQSELSEMLSVPVMAKSVRADGGQPSNPDVLVRRGPDERLRNVLGDGRPVFPSPGCTAITVYPHESRRPPLVRRLLERLTF